MKKTAFIFLSFIIIFSVALGSVADADTLTAARYVYENTKKPTVGSIGGEWAIIGLARNGENLPTEYTDNYYEAVLKYVKDRGGVLHDKKYTEYSRLIIALTAIGKDPENVAGYNLLEPLCDFDKTVWQGINGAIWALIALDCGDYELPSVNGIENRATREMYVWHILSAQKADGGWTMVGDSGDADITGMAITALSNYRENPEVEAAVQRAVEFLSNLQGEDGMLSGYNANSAESFAQIIVGLCSNGISPNDKRFVKNGTSFVDCLLKYQLEDGSFKHSLKDLSSNKMATEQAFYALVAAERLESGKAALYDMSDVKKDENEKEAGLAGRDAAVQRTAIIYEEKTFSDIKNCAERDAIEALARRGIITGKTNELFDPDATLTRAEAAAIIVRALGLQETATENFSDVNETDWFAPYVSTASGFKIVLGNGDNRFNPSGTITREEAAVIVVRAAKLCGIDTKREDFAIRNSLAEFTDYTSSSSWARASLAVCFDEGILSRSLEKIEPQKGINRATLAQMIYNMLERAELL